METTKATQALDAKSSALPVTEDGTNAYVPEHNCLQEALKWQDIARGQVKKDIAEIKSLGQPIYYLQDDRLIRENADGSKFYCLVQQDGTEQILEEVQ
jgi:hypothetical protein